MTTRILIAVDIEDAAMIDAYGSTDYDADDLVASFDARLSEVYCGQHDVPVRAAVVALGDFSAGALWSLIQAAEVGADGLDEEQQHIVNGSLATMSQMLYATDGKI